MGSSRRELLKGAAMGAAAAAMMGMQGAVGAQAAPDAGGAGGSGALRQVPLRIGMCDWNLGKTGQVSAVELAYRCGLDGVEASVNFPDGGGGLRSPEELRGYRQACHRYGIEVPSVAMGILNSVPLKSEPKTALWVADAIAVGEKLGATCMLLAFFGPGELDMGDATSIGRVVDVLKELAPRAAAAGVSLGLENYLSAEDNLTLLDRVGSPAVQVYYDVRNSADKGRDPAKELRALKGRVCQVHLKNGDRLLSEKGEVDFAACAQALKETDYDGWLVLETASPSGSIVEDTKRNIAYIRSVF